MKFKKWLDSRKKQTEGFNPFSKLFKKQAPIPAPVANPIAKPKHPGDMGMNSNDFRNLMKSIHGNDVVGEPEASSAPSQPSSYNKVYILVDTEDRNFVLGVYKSRQEARAASIDWHQLPNGWGKKGAITLESEFEGADVPNGSPVFILWSRLHSKPFAVYDKENMPKTYQHHELTQDEDRPYYIIEKKINYPPGIGPDHHRTSSR
jgi:hypothetical protein